MWITRITKITSSRQHSRRGLIHSGKIPAFVGAALAAARYWQPRGLPVHGETSEVSQKNWKPRRSPAVPAPRVGINPHAISSMSLQDKVWLGVLLGPISCKGRIGPGKSASRGDAQRMAREFIPARLCGRPLSEASVGGFSGQPRGGCPYIRKHPRFVGAALAAAHVMPAPLRGQARGPAPTFENIPGL